MQVIGWAGPIRGLHLGDNAGGWWCPWFGNGLFLGHFSWSCSENRGLRRQRELVLGLLYDSRMSNGFIRMSEDGRCPAICSEGVVMRPESTQWSTD